jgi:putative ABC transport system permease protein
MSWRRFFRRGPADAELVQEIDVHLAEEIDENVARGMRADEAKRRAYLKFGNPTKMREATWTSNSIAPLESLLRNLRYAWRVLMRNPGYALLAILTLGLGIGANTAIFTVINGVLLRPLPYAEAGQIVHLDLTAAKLGPDPLGLSVQEIRDFREQNHVFSNVAEYHAMTFTLLGSKDPERVVTGVVSGNYFDVLGVKPLLGRLLLPADESLTAPPVLVLSYAYWMKEFGGDRNILGRTFEMNDRVHTVVGVLPPLPEFPDADDVYMPTTSCPFRSAPAMIANRDQRMLTGFARLKPGVTLAQANLDLASVGKRLALAYPKSYPASEGIAPEAIAVEQELTHAARPTFFILLGASGLVLLLACANLANIALSRQMQRSREMAIRMATGASPWNLFCQLLTESMMIALAGGLVGMGIAAIGSKVLIDYAAHMTSLAAGIRLDGNVLLFGLGVSLLAGLLFGVLPGYVASRVGLTSLGDAGERATGSSSGTRMRSLLVTTQVTISFVLLICAGLTLRSLYNLLSVDPGFKTANVLSMQISLNWTKYQKPEAAKNFFHQTLERVQTTPGVQSAALSMAVPLNSDMGPMTAGVAIEGQPLHRDEPVPQINFELASPDYFGVLGIPLLAGRSFSSSDQAQAPPVVIVNDRMARHYWPHENPLGHRVAAGDGDKKTWASVVGVVSDVHQYGLDKEPAETMYFPVDQAGLTSGHLLVRTRGNPMRMATQVAGIIHQIDPQQPVTEVRTLEQVRSAQLGTPRVTSMLLSIFAAVALFITIVGVSGTLALSVARRSKEIGIRIALGATKENILRNVLMRGMIPVLTGVGLGSLAAAFTTRALAKMLFGIKPDDPGTFVAIAILFLIVALLGCVIPARRAVKVDPMIALRTE